MLRVTDSWVWDNWVVDDGELFHVFYLKAPKALGDPELRHDAPRVGHATSSDLVNWTELPDALMHSDGPAFDDQGIWTGSIVRGDDTWHLFYTGISRETGHEVQRIGHAISDDLSSWIRVSTQPVVSADERWYGTRPQLQREDWRDPWVFRMDDTWHMLVTAQAAQGELGARGVIAHATSADLNTWTVLEPLSQPAGFHHLEVLQVLEEHGKHVVVFCASAHDVKAEHLPRETGTWTAPADSPLGPFHLESAEPIAVEGNYAGRLVRDRAGIWNLVAFVDVMSDGSFGGVLGNPVPLELTERGTMQPAQTNATAIFRWEN